MSYSLNCRVDLGSSVTGIPLFANCGVFSTKHYFNGARVPVRGVLTNNKTVEVTVLHSSRTIRSKGDFNFEVVTSD